MPRHSAPKGTIAYIPNRRHARAVRMQLRSQPLGISAAKSFALDPNQPYKEALRAATEAAEAWVAETLDSIRKKTVAPDTLRLTVAGLIDSYLKDPAVVAKKTLHDKRRLLAWWAAECGSTRVLDFDTLKIRQARDTLSAGKRGAATVNRHISEMRSAWNWGRATKHIPAERSWPQRTMLPEPAGRTRYLSDAELAKLLATAAPDPMMHAAIVTSIGTGLRQGELLRLQWPDLDLTDGAGRAYVGESKNGERRTVFLPDPAIDALKKLRGNGVVTHMSGPVLRLPNNDPVDMWRLNSRWRKVRKAAGLKNFRWHDLRHSCASYLAQHGATLLGIGSVLGHKSTSVTLRYAHLVQGKPLPSHAALAAKLRGGK